MSNKRTKQVLSKIITHIEHTLEYVQGHNFDSFMKDRMLQEACVFNVLQVGELSKVGLDDAFTTQHPEIAWHQMYGMRNRIVHDYDGLRMKIIWQTISGDFPVLKEQLQNILSSIEDNDQ
ncbi:MAG: DUF86 domain-containing protein [Clostridia bacterium]|nr:DUF86 domain-containing protein [Clostridia bacterium]